GERVGDRLRRFEHQATRSADPHAAGEVSGNSRRSALSVHAMDPIAAAQEATNAGEFERLVLDGLARAIGAEAAFFATGKAATTTLIEREALERAFGDPQLGREMVALDRAAAARRGVCVDTDVLGEARKQTTYFRRYAAPLGGKHSLFATLTVRGAPYGKVML